MATSSASSISSTRPRYGPSRLTRCRRRADLTGRPPRARSSRVRNTWSRQALLGDLAVERGVLEQLRVRAAGHDAPLLEHHHLVCQRDRGESVGDHERRAPLHHLGERGLDAALGVASTLEVASSRIRMRGSASSARAIAALALTAESVGRARRRGCRGIGQIVQHLRQPAPARRRPRFRLRSRPGARRRCWRAKAEKEGVVGDDGHLAAQRSGVHRAHVRAVHEHRARVHVVEPRHEHHEVVLPERGSHERHGGRAPTDSSTSWARAGRRRSRSAGGLHPPAAGGRAGRRGR